jgi:integrase
MSHRFEEQAIAWLAGLEARKRNPVSPVTLTTYSAHVKRLLPLVGADTLLSEIHNGFLKDLAGRILGSPKTVNESLAALKQIIKSARDPQTGVQLYPRIWDHEFIDVPTIKDQKQPCATVEQIRTAIKTARSWQEQLLYVILAGTGLRISEALAIRVGPVADDQSAFLESESVIKVRASIWKNQEYRGKLKTEASKRDIDLDPRLPSRIAEFIRAHKIDPGSFLFQAEGGDVANLETITRRLKQRQVPGFHSFRRYRITKLRQANIPEDLIRYWSGHSGKGITDRYAKSAEDRDYRKHWCKAAGLGFDLQHLGHPTRLRKRRSRLERYNAMLKADLKPASYQATNVDLPEYFFAQAP